MRGVLREAEVQVVGVEQGDAIRVGDKDGLEFRVLWPPDMESKYVAVLGDQIDLNDREQLLNESAKRGNLNERSVVLSLLEGNKLIYLIGDAGDQTEKTLLGSGVLQDIDILKVGHHGSKYASTEIFLEKVKPETALISVGARNRYGHPTDETLGRLSKVGAKIMRTDLVGSLVIDL